MSSVYREVGACENKLLTVSFPKITKTREVPAARRSGGLYRKLISVLRRSGYCCFGFRSVKDANNESDAVVVGIVSWTTDCESKVEAGDRS